MTIPKIEVVTLETDKLLASMGKALAVGLLGDVPITLRPAELKCLLDTIHIYKQALVMYADFNNWATYDGAHWAGPLPYDDGYALARHALAWPEVTYNDKSE